MYLDSLLQGRVHQVASIKSIKQNLRWQYKRYISSLFSEGEKAALRQRVLSLPITDKYPFSPEAKLLRAMGIKGAMLDIGANTGIYSALLEDIVGSDNLYLFEPLPHLHGYLKQRFKKLSNHEITAFLILI